jgi:CheY-like chemotaxis protein
MGGSARILVVEDDPILRDAMVQQLGEHGYDVDAAANGAVGLEKALIRRPDVVLFDFNMPVTDGPTLVDELRSLVTPLPVLVAISGRFGAKQWCAEHGVGIFLGKPFGDSTLQRTVVSAVDLLTRVDTVRPSRASATSIPTACVLAVGGADEGAVRELLPHSLKHARVVIVESHDEAMRMLDHVIPELLVLEGTARHEKLRGLAVSRGIPMLLREEHAG